MEAFKVLDVIMRGLIIPGIYVFVLFAVPGLKEDLQDKARAFCKFLIPQKTKRKAVRMRTRPGVTHTNSLPRLASYYNELIVTHR